MTPLASRQYHRPHRLADVFWVRRMTCSLAAGSGQWHALRTWPAFSSSNTDHRPRSRRLGHALGVLDLRECSASSWAITREVRSRSKAAAMRPPTIATTSAIHEKRSSQRSAATPA